MYDAQRADRDPELGRTGEDRAAPGVDRIVVARAGIEPEDDRDLVELIDLCDVACRVATLIQLTSKRRRRHVDRGRVSRSACSRCGQSMRTSSTPGRRRGTAVASPCASAGCASLVRHRIIVRARLPFVVGRRRAHRCPAAGALVVRSRDEEDDQETRPTQGPDDGRGASRTVTSSQASPTGRAIEDPAQTWSSPGLCTMATRSRRGVVEGRVLLDRERAIGRVEIVDSSSVIAAAEPANAFRPASRT